MNIVSSCLLYSRKIWRYPGIIKSRQSIKEWAKPKTTQKTKARVAWTPLRLAVNPDTPQRLVVPIPLVTHVVLLLYDTSIICYEARVEYKYTLINANNTNKTWTTNKMNGSKDEPNILLGGNRSRHGNREIKMWRHVIRKQEQQEPH